MRFSLSLQINNLRCKQSIYAPVQGRDDHFLQSDHLLPRHSLIRQLFSVALLLTLLIVAAPLSAGTLSVVGHARWVKVGTIFDGDTFRTNHGERVRLLGINTPEVAHDNHSEQPYAREAKQRLRELIAGKTVQLRFDRDKRDTYGRTLAQLYLRDGRWVNRILVAEGLAHLYIFAPNFYRANALLAAERTARRDMLGLWKSNRFRILDASDIANRHIGQFRLIRGYVDASHRWRFRLGKRLNITVPRKVRRWFSGAEMPKNGQKVIVHGVIRRSSTGDNYLSLHSPFDLESRL